MQKSLRDEIKYLEKILVEKPNSMLFARLADCYMQMGRLDEAIELCEHGVRLHPNYISGHFVLGKCYVRKKLFDLGEKELKRVIVLDPKYIAAYRELGELTALNGWQNACETNFLEILRIDPLNERAKQRLAMLKQQFILNEQMQSPPEPPSFQPEKEDDSFLHESVLTETDDTLLDLEESAPAQPPVEAAPEPSQTAFNENDRKELDLLDDIFSDDSISDIENEPTFNLAEEPQPSPFTDAETEPTVPESPFDALGNTATDTNVPPRQEPPEKPEHLPPGDTSQAEYDPFYELQKQRELESQEIEDSLFPFDSEKEETRKSEPEPQIPDFEPKLSQPMPAREEKQPIQKPEPPRPSSSKGSLATPTLGEIYAAQRQYAKAIGVYEQLLKKDPDNEMYKQKIELLKRKMEEDAG